MDFDRWIWVFRACLSADLQAKLDELMEDHPPEKCMELIHDEAEAYFNQMNEKHFYKATKGNNEGHQEG